MGSENKLQSSLNAIRVRPMKNIFSIDAIFDAMMGACVVVRRHTIKARYEGMDGETAIYYTKNIEASLQRMEESIRKWIVTLLGGVLFIKSFEASPCRRTNGMAWMMRLPYIGRLAFVGSYIL